MPQMTDGGDTCQECKPAKSPSLLTCATGDMLDCAGMVSFFVVSEQLAQGLIAATATGGAAAGGTLMAALGALSPVTWAVIGIAAAVGVASYIGSNYVKRKVAEQDAEAKAQPTVSNAPVRGQNLQPTRDRNVGDGFNNNMDVGYSSSLPNLKQASNKQPGLF